MIRPSTDLSVYIPLPRTDGLALLAQEVMELNPFDKALFVFGNLQRYKVKLLFWERKDFVV